MLAWHDWFRAAAAVLELAAAVRSCEEPSAGSAATEGADVASAAQPTRHCEQ